MGINRAVVLAIPFVIIAFVAGSYFARWFGVILGGIILMVILFFLELEEGYGLRAKKKPKPEIRSDFERMVALIEKSKKGKVAREIISDEIRGIYALISEDYTREFYKLKNNPNRALRVLKSEGDFLKNLRKALEIVEVDLNENSGSS